MTMNMKISGELSPFFKFANSSNPSKVVGQWIDSDDERTRTHRAYQNCVNCNTKRFKEEDLSYLPAGTNSYFCKSCYQKVAVVVLKCEKEDFKELNKVWNDKLFGQSKL